jgi:hypothetical protein
MKGKIETLQSNSDEPNWDLLITPVRRGSSHLFDCLEEKDSS